MEQLVSLWLQTFWQFLPAVVANQCPGFVAYFAKKYPVPFHRPVSVRWLGGNKTYSAYYAGLIGALLTSALQDNLTSPSAFLGSLLLGLGAIIGDHGESFVKRRVGIAPGDAWWPFDQLDFLAGAILCSSFVMRWDPIGVALLSVSILLIHPIGNYIGMRLGLRKTWW